MIFRTLYEIQGTEREVFAENNNWVSRRLLLKKDGMGFSLHDTIMFANTETLIHYKHHLEGVYCVDGEGEIEIIETGKVYSLVPGAMYALNNHEKHFLRAHPEKDMRIICVFNPPITGTEDHQKDGSYQMGFNTKKLKFVYFNFQEHPRGNFMLNSLINYGYIPDAIVEEESSLAVKGREKLTIDLQKIDNEKSHIMSTKEIIGKNNIHHFLVSNHNSIECQEIIKKYEPDLIVLGDTRIMLPPVIQIPKIGVVNVHPGYLPDVKGNNPYLWAIIHGLPQGVTVHFIDNEIDTGPIILRKKILLDKGMTYPLLLSKINEICGELTVEAMCYISGGMTNGIPQRFFQRESHEFGVFKLCPPELKSKAIEMLES